MSLFAPVRERRRRHRACKTGAARARQRSLRRKLPIAPRTAPRRLRRSTLDVATAGVSLTAGSAVSVPPVQQRLKLPLPLIGSTDRLSVHSRGRADPRETGREQMIDPFHLLLDAILARMNMQLRAVLVENEEHSRARLRRLLQGFPQDVEVVGEAVDGPSAVTEIRAKAPDLVFLDIDLPGFNGFQVLDELDQQPIVIYTTAYDKHALDAFKTRVVDYLLKPIDAEAVGRALAKLRAMRLDPSQFAQRLARWLDHAPPEYLTRLMCREGDRTRPVKVSEILYFQADHKLTSVHSLKREYLIDTPLVDLERRLNPKEFIRIHRATLVNLSWIAEIRRADDGKLTVLLKDAKATSLAVSRIYAENLRSL